MNQADASLLSVLTVAAPDDPWVTPAGAFRIVMHPGLGWPLAPFAVLRQPLSPLLATAAWSLTGAGPSNGGEVDGEAWLVLAGRAGQPDPGYVVLTLQFDQPPEAAAVRRPGDTAPGSATRTGEPYILTAPAISVIRIRGRCRVVSVSLARPALDVTFSDTSLLALPVPDVWPGYHNLPDPESPARQRVQDGAPPKAGPHEQALHADPAAEELRRVTALVEPWVQGAVRDLVQRPIPDRFTPSDLGAVSGSALPATAVLDDHAAVLAAATDFGVARWLGLGDHLPPWQGQTLLVAAAAVWALPPGHELAGLAHTISDKDTARSMLQQVYPDGFLGDIDALGQSLPLLWLWTYAWVDSSAPADPPPAPQLTATRQVTWIAGATPDDDVAIVPIDAQRVPLLGELGIVRSSGQPVQPPISGAAGRVRPLVAVEGTALTDRFTTPFGARSYRAWQADAFGRWGAAGSLHIPALTRPALPVPQLMISRLWDQPSGTDPWSPRLRVTVPVPVRAGGQPAIAAVQIQADDGPQSQPTAGQTEVSFDCAGPALTAGQSAAAQVSAAFLDPAGQVLTMSQAAVAITDPRPPAPPAPAPVLYFSARPDGSGTSTAAVPLIPGGQITAYYIDVASEPDLRSVSTSGPPSGADPDARARWWLQQSRQELAPAFARVTQQAVPVTQGTFPYPLAGDLAHLMTFRLVPVGVNGASPDPVSCPVMFFAVPRDVAPPPPVLGLRRDTVPPFLDVRCGQGAVPAAEYRLRMLDGAARDPRAGLVVGQGALTGGEAVAPVPVLRPFTLVRLVAEVRGEQQAGQPPFPGRWSQPSSELRYLDVPDGPPGFVTGARLSGTAVLLDIDPGAAPAVLADYSALIYSRDPATGSFVVWRGPLTLAAELDGGTALPPWAAVVVVVDPIGRRGSPVPVTGGVEFADWTDAGDTSASGLLCGHDITLAGQAGSVTVIDGSAVFVSGAFSPPLPASNTAYIVAMSGRVFTITFSAPVQDPVLHLASCGSALDFAPQIPVEVSGDDAFTVSGSTVSGQPMNPADANGTVRLPGVFTSLTFSVTLAGGASGDGIYVQVGGVAAG
jgi:hypothetical protein